MFVLEWKSVHKQSFILLFVAHDIKQVTHLTRVVVDEGFKEVSNHLTYGTKVHSGSLWRLGGTQLVLKVTSFRQHSYRVSAFIPH